MGSYANKYEFATKTVSKNVVKKSVSIALLLKKLMICLRETKYNFIKKNCKN